MFKIHVNKRKIQFTNAANPIRNFCLQKLQTLRKSGALLRKLQRLIFFLENRRLKNKAIAAAIAAISEEWNVKHRPYPNLKHLWASRCVIALVNLWHATWEWLCRVCHAKSPMALFSLFIYIWQRSSATPEYQSNFYLLFFLVSMTWNSNDAKLTHIQV